MSKIHYYSDIIILAGLISVLVALTSKYCSLLITLVGMSIFLAIILIDIGANANGHLIIKIATRLFKLTDRLTLKIIGVGRSSANRIKSKVTAKEK